MSNVISDLMTVKDQVERVLRDFPGTRNNDFYLALIVLREYYIPELQRLDWTKIQECSGKLKSIINLRQSFNRQGLYLPTDPEILAHRRRKAVVLRKAIPQMEYGESV